MARSALAERFAASSQSPAKTVVLEVHADRGNGRQACVEALVSGIGAVRPTSDAFLFEVRADDLQLWVDTLDNRFWSFHSWSAATAVRRYLKDRVERRRDLDFIWLPSRHLRGAWPMTEISRLRADFRGNRFLPPTTLGRDLRVQIGGGDSQELIDYLQEREDYRPSIAFHNVEFRASDPHFGTAAEGLNRMGQFVAAGDSFELHQEIVRAVIRRYERLVTLVEKRALKWEALPAGGLRPAGSPLLLRFSRPVPDMEMFLDGLFAAREPFRLWGVPQQTHDGVWSVEAVDLHVGQRIGMDVAHDWMRVYLLSGACGNSVVRLVANLQHSFDAGVRFADPELQAALQLDGESAGL